MPSLYWSGRRPPVKRWVDCTLEALNKHLFGKRSRKLLDALLHGLGRRWNLLAAVTDISFLYQNPNLHQVSLSPTWQRMQEVILLRIPETYRERLWEISGNMAVVAFADWAFEPEEALGWPYLEAILEGTDEPSQQIRRLSEAMFRRLDPPLDEALSVLAMVRRPAPRTILEGLLDFCGLPPASLEELRRRRLVRPSLLPDLGSDGEEVLEVETPLRWAEHCHPRGEAARYEVFGYLAQAFDTLAWEHPDARVTWSLGLGESLYYAVEQTVVSPENFRSGQFLQIEHWLQWATQLSLQQRYQEAVDIYEKVLLRDPTNAYAYEYRAFNRQRLGVRPEMLLVDYRRAVQIRPHVMLYQKRYIEILIRVGRFKEAWWQMNEATDQCAADPGLYTFLYPEVALAFWEQGRTEEAARILNRLPCEYQQDRRIQEVRDQLLGRDAGGRINPFPSLVQPDRATVAQVFQELDQILSGV